MLFLGAASSALVALAWLAQAEAAPTEEAPPTTAAPAPVAAAPPDPTAGELEEAPRRRINSIAVSGGLSTRPSGPDAGIPRGGFSLGGAFEHRYGGLADTFGFGVGLDFFFDHFAGGSTQNSFVALQTVVLERLAVRPWLAVGAGIGVATEARAVVRGALGLELPFSRENSITVRADVTHALAGDRAFTDIVDLGVGLLQRF